jgi:hypothetical protein
LRTKKSPEDENILWPVNTGGNLKIRALSGKELLHNSDKLFCHQGNHGLKNYSIATPETKLRVDELMKEGSCSEIFESLPGIWSQKWLTQNQVVEICETLSFWLAPDDKKTIFLCKKDEILPVDEDNIAENLVVIVVVSAFRDGNLLYHGRKNVYNIPFSMDSHFKPEDHIRIFSPI